MFVNALFFCISFLASPAWTKDCTGKLIANNLCIPKEYTNQFSQSYPNQEQIYMGLQQATLLDIDPKKNTISVHIIISMEWADDRLELQNGNYSDRFGTNDAVNLWRPFYIIKR